MMVMAGTCSTSSVLQSLQWSVASKGGGLRDEGAVRT